MEMSLRHKLHPFTADNGRTYLPASCHTMLRDDKTHFFKVIRNVLVPDGYASNVSRCVRLYNMGLKESSRPCTDATTSPYCIAQITAR
jgi:hypothetical protein